MSSFDNYKKSSFENYATLPNHGGSYGWRFGLYWWGMKTYLINLDRATERLRGIETHLRGIGVAYERIAAVDGRELSPAQRRMCCNRLRFFILHARRPQPAEIGCALSHQAVYARMEREGVALALVLEDDARLDPGRLADSLARIATDNRPGRPQAWLLYGGGIPAAPRSEERAFVPVRDGAAFTPAYAINLDGAKRLRRLNGRVQALADVWGRWAACGVEVKWVTPFACTLAEVPSQICWDVPRRARWGWYRALWRVRHAAGRWLDRMLYRVVGH